MVEAIEDLDTTSILTYEYVRERMVFGRWRALRTFAAILLAFLLCGCDMGITPAAPTAIPSIQTSGPTSVAQVIAGPTQVQAASTTAADTPYIKRPPSTATAITLYVAPTTTPQLHGTETPMQVSPSPTFFTGFTGCGPDMSAGGAAHVWTDCWQGIINGYQVFVSAGYDQTMYAQGCGLVEGLYDISAWLPGARDHSFADFQGGGCGPNHILKISGSVITFDMGTVDLGPVLPAGTPSPVSTATNTPVPLTASGPFDTIFPGCSSGIGAGGSSQIWTDCWLGVVNGYEVFARAGFVRHIGSQVCGGEEGIYAIAALYPGDENASYSYLQTGGCGPNHILKISGSIITSGMGTVDLGPVLPTATPLPSPTLTKTPTPKPTLGVGFVECSSDTSSGGEANPANPAHVAQFTTNCWHGIIDGYDVIVTAGVVFPSPDRNRCSTPGFYKVEAWLPSTYPYFAVQDREYSGCSALSILSVSGSVISFTGGDRFSVDIAPLLLKPTPTVTPR
jgi:hypothetical protein